MAYVNEVGVAPVDKREYRALWSQASLGLCPDSVGHGDSVGQGLCPGSAFNAAEYGTSGLEDRKQAYVAFQLAGAAPDANNIANRALKL